MKLQRSCGVMVGVFLLASGFVDQGYAYPGAYGPGIAISVPLPPPIVFSAPPELVVVPGTNVYVAPDIEGDVLFHQGLWWRLYDGHWYRSRSYGGPWRYIVRERVPPVIFGFSPGFRHAYRGSHRLHHGEVERNWRGWEQGRHGERHGY